MAKSQLYALSPRAAASLSPRDWLEPDELHPAVQSFIQFGVPSGMKA